MHLKNAFLKRRNLEHIFLFFLFQGPPLRGGSRLRLPGGRGAQRHPQLGRPPLPGVPRRVLRRQGRDRVRALPEGHLPGRAQAGPVQAVPARQLDAGGRVKVGVRLRPRLRAWHLQPGGARPLPRVPGGLVLRGASHRRVQGVHRVPAGDCLCSNGRFLLYFKSNSRQKKFFLRFCYHHANYHLPHMYTVNLLVFSSLQDTYTAGPGSRSPDECRPRCPPGMYSETGLAPCAPCPKNFFQPLAGQRQCFECHGSEETK